MTIHATIASITHKEETSLTLKIIKAKTPHIHLSTFFCFTTNLSLCFVRQVPKLAFQLLLEGQKEGKRKEEKERKQQCNVVNTIEKVC